MVNNWTVSKHFIPYYGIILQALRNHEETGIIIILSTIQVPNSFLE
jgi:hypothetical protein